MGKVQFDLGKQNWPSVLYINQAHLYLPVLESQKKSCQRGRWTMQTFEEI
jgi:hypothetical protein